MLKRTLWLFCIALPLLPAAVLSQMCPTDVLTTATATYYNVSNPPTNRKAPVDATVHLVLCASTPGFYVVYFEDGPSGFPFFKGWPSDLCINHGQCKLIVWLGSKPKKFFDLGPAHPAIAADKSKYPMGIKGPFPKKPKISILGSDDGYSVSDVILQ